MVARTRGTRKAVSRREELSSLTPLPNDDSPGRPSSQEMQPIDADSSLTTDSSWEGIQENNGIRSEEEPQLGQTSRWKQNTQPTWNTTQTPRWNLQTERNPKVGIHESKVSLRYGVAFYRRRTPKKISD